MSGITFMVADRGERRPRSPMKRKLRIMAVAMLIGITVFVICAWIAGGILMAPRNHPLGKPPGDLPISVVQFPSSSGAILRGWLISGDQSHGVIVLMHGVRGSRLDLMNRARFLHRAGYSLLLFDFQAHGESLGKHITFGYLESRDAIAAVAFVRRQFPGKRIGVLGGSLGGASAVLATPQLEVNAMILESVYPTINNALQDRLAIRLGSFGKALAPALTWQLKPRLGIRVDALRPIDRVGHIAVPKLFLAGTQDRHTPLSEAKDLFNAAANPKEFWEISQGCFIWERNLRSRIRLMAND